MHYPNSSRSAFSGTSLPQCSSAFFLNSAIKLLFHIPCCASRGLAMHTTSSSSTFLSSFPFSCAFSFTGHTGLSCCAFCGLVTHATFFFFLHNGHSLHLCPFSPYLKYSTSAISTFLIILPSTLHYITLLLNISNLFWETIVLFFSSFLFLQFWARCLNPLQLKHNFSLFSSNSSLSLTRECFSLSKLLISELYYCKDIVLRLCKGYGFNN